MREAIGRREFLQSVAIIAAASRASGQTPPAGERCSVLGKSGWFREFKECAAGFVGVIELVEEFVPTIAPEARNTKTASRKAARDEASAALAGESDSDDAPPAKATKARKATPAAASDDED